MLDATVGNRRENRFVLPPFFTEGIFPIDVGLDAVAITNVHDCGTGQPGDGALQCFDTPGIHFVEKHVERWFVELNHIDAVGF